MAGPPAGRGPTFPLFPFRSGGAPPDCETSFRGASSLDDDRTSYNPQRSFPRARCARSSVTSGGESKNHHWWPKGLQKYWTDWNGRISWIEPSGAIQSERQHRGNIASILYGHTLFRGDVWQTNFEEQFSIDVKVHDLIEALNGLVPDGHEEGKYGHFKIGERFNRQLTLFILSLTIRSPSQRHIYEHYPESFNLPPDENVGKANMNLQYGVARRLCETSSVSNRHFSLLHSEEPRFICGDGCLDCLSAGLLANRVNGRALIALTPHLCVYINTPMMMRSDRNCTAIRATRSMIKRANAITQIYSKKKLFFLGNPPELTADFRRGEHLQHATFSDSLLNEVDELVGHTNGRQEFFRGVW